MFNEIAIRLLQLANHTSYGSKNYFFRFFIFDIMFYLWHDIAFARRKKNCSVNKNAQRKWSIKRQQRNGNKEAFFHIIVQHFLLILNKYFRPKKSCGKNHSELTHNMYYFIMMYSKKKLVYNNNV